ncbi:MAG: H-NS histone family protein [Pseudomonadota bacterium]|nr:H-NS histone family protein [Pseudomonadota bacterium]
MTIDLNALSTRELDSLITQAEKRKATLKKRRPIATVRAKFRAAAKAEGYTVEELFGGKAARSAATRTPRKTSKTKGRKLGKVAPKYRNPAKPSETWTGRGKPPRWMAPLLKKGKKPEDFLIKK